jgi:imidazolonepropionase-like amidohydrolase
MIIIRNGQIHTAVSREVFYGDILIDDNGKIGQIAHHIETTADREIQAEGLEVYPGFVDAHCHVGLDVYAEGPMGMEFNETNDPVTPQLSAIDGINPFDHHLELARNGGVTCVSTGPGSSNAIGGTFTAIKTYGKRVDDMVVKKAVAMKCAFGENPKRFYQSKGISSRMTNAAVIRSALKKAEIYLKKVELAGDDISKYPAYDPKCEALIPVLRREIPLKAHAHQANDIFTALRIAKEFGLRLTLEHVTEGHLIADELKKENVPMAVGPFFSSSSKLEFQNVNPATAGILANAGCHVCIVTDAPVVPLQALPLFAGMAVRAGMDPYDALRAITINAAEHLGIEDRVGSLEPGKDGDVVSLLKRQ